MGFSEKFGGETSISFLRKNDRSGTPVVTQLLVTANKLPDILSSRSSNWGNPNNRCSL